MNVKPDHEDEGALADRIVLAMTDLAGAMGRLNDLVAQRVGVGPTDLLCLHTLNREGPSTAGALSARLGRTTGAITQMIDRLQRAGYVQRRPHPEDRRSVLVEAVPDALGKVAALYAGLDTRSRRLMSEFSAEQLATIHAFLAASHQNAVQESDLLTG
ncbi:MarR family transcriptional regulator [Microtetraspora sp. AC03309]|uniref:MarR family winged helix-turn-helix transcriptional regulator n=1 Tax=Microtetraspora sp. AC03309 TaxID=2779376 RepID=UPI001E479FB1|nr:MarR family transcriptional regulator [Microtetraspora sp. AC03309]MCC5576971.1 MarR family transcriptional regulator [Microtetraspora sp. AC03309]